MNRRAIKYRDTNAAPGSDLHAALEAGDTQRAEQIYRQCEARLQFEQGNSTPRKEHHANGSH